MSTAVEQLDVKGLAQAIGPEAAAETVRAMMPDDLREFADAMRDTFGAKLAFMEVRTESGAIQVGRRAEYDEDSVWRPGADFEARLKARRDREAVKSKPQQKVANLRYK